MYQVSEDSLHIQDNWTINKYFYRIYMLIGKKCKKWHTTSGIRVSALITVKHVHILYLKGTHSIYYGSIEILIISGNTKNNFFYLTKFMVLFLKIKQNLMLACRSALFM